MLKVKAAVGSSRSIDDVIPNIFKEFGRRDAFNGGFRDSSSADVSILILNTPCNGFGDLIFGMKLANYLKEWFPASAANIHIATTLPDGLAKLGFDKESIVQLGKKSPQCRRFRYLEIVNYKTGRVMRPRKYDLLFVAPLSQDFEISRSDVKVLFPYSNRFNTFFFSEYNDSLKKGFDFPTGVGRGRMGMTLTTVRPLSAENKVAYEKLNLGGVDSFAVAYIAQTITGSFQCFKSFYDMLAAKYPQKKFSIVVPKWIVDEWSGDTSVPTPLILQARGGEYPITLRGDVFPVPNAIMLEMMKNSMREILLTGDQSITDALSCCFEKNIFYQIAPWKTNFGKHLSEKLPNKYLKTKKTSCGSVLAVGYDSDYTEFVKTWDFRVLARPMIEGIVNYTATSKKRDKEGRRMKEFEESVLSARSVKSLSSFLEKERKN